jgi:hypothetical protein
LKDPTYPTMDREVPKTGALLGILTVPTAKWCGTLMDTSTQLHS